MAARVGQIYAYTTPAYRNTPWKGRRRGRGLIKVGYTQRDAHTRIREQIGASSPEKDPYTLLMTSVAKTRRGESFSDKDVHAVLRRMGAKNVHNEWFEATPADVRKALGKLSASKIRKGTPRYPKRRRGGKFKLVIFATALVIFSGLVLDTPGTLAKLRYVVDFAFTLLSKFV
jgi:hypothetical protein